MTFIYMTNKLVKASKKD